MHCTTDSAGLWHGLQFPNIIAELFTTPMVNMTSIFVQETKAQNHKSSSDGYKHFELFFVDFVNFYVNNINQYADINLD